MAATACDLGNIVPSERRLEAIEAATSSRERGAAVSTALCEQKHHLWIVECLILSKGMGVATLGTTAIHTATLALKIIRNMARVPAIRGTLADVGGIDAVVRFLPESSGSADRHSDGAVRSDAWAAAESAAVEALINLGCLHANKQRIVDAGGVACLLRCIGDAARSLELQELAASCLGCITHLCDPETASAVIAAGVLVAIEAMLATVVDAPPSVISSIQAELLHAVVDVLKNVVMHAPARPLVLATGRLVENAIAVAVLVQAPPKVRVNTAQALRIVACGPDDDGSLHPALIDRGYTAALEATEPLMARLASIGGGSGGTDKVSLSVLAALAPALAKDATAAQPTLCMPCGSAKATPE